MTKRRTKPRSAPRPTQIQLNRIEDLGEQIYGDDWTTARARVLPKGMTREQAVHILLRLDSILGGGT